MAFSILNICEIFNTISYLLNLNIFGPYIKFLKNKTFSFRLLCLRDIFRFANMFFFIIVFGRTLIPECVYRP